MIENRLRLEREVLRGRRAVRRTVLSREPVPASDVDPGNVPDLSMGAAPSPDVERGENVWPMETDTDTPFKYDERNGKLRLWPIKEGQHASGSSTPVELKGSNDPLRSPARRRRWTSHLLETGDQDQEAVNATQDFGLGTPDPLPPFFDSPAIASSPSSENQGFMQFANPSGVLRSFRDRSFGRLSSPFKSPRGKGKEAVEQAVDLAWSSDSSELDEELDLPEGDFRDDDEDFGGPILSSSREL